MRATTGICSLSGVKVGVNLIVETTTGTSAPETVFATPPACSGSNFNRNGNGSDQRKPAAQNSNKIKRFRKLCQPESQLHLIKRLYKAVLQSVTKCIVYIIRIIKAKLTN